MKGQSLDAWCGDAHSLATIKGFWAGNDTRNDPQFLGCKLALIHAEVSELLEAVRDRPGGLCDKLIDLTREQEEVADIFLRLADYCGARGINLEMAVTIKHEYNKTRGPLHGKSF